MKRKESCGFISSNCKLHSTIKELVWPISELLNCAREIVVSNFVACKSFEIGISLKKEHKIFLNYKFMSPNSQIFLAYFLGKLSRMEQLYIDRRIGEY